MKMSMCYSAADLWDLLFVVLYLTYFKQIQSDICYYTFWTGLYLLEESEKYRLLSKKTFDKMPLFFPLKLLLRACIKIAVSILIWFCGKMKRLQACFHYKCTKCQMMLHQMLNQRQLFRQFLFFLFVFFFSCYLSLTFPAGSVPEAHWN